VTGRAFWPSAEAVQADYEVLPDYEVLRAHVLTCGSLLAGLMAWPTAEPEFRAELAGAARPP
jgi:hypothetical protein